ncbi:recombinase family protein [Ignavigranum ruoffiae]|uniref:recombinase family protein n=1 Tax=Ignavigranum ruoffiae TaxID=89093 RepID=UPI0024AD66DA|nr:recombinase family protein [Ignavigranum ruoffiae]
MDLKDNMYYIPARRQPKQNRVAIYARVSSNTKDQLRSLANQVSALTQKVSLVEDWRLVDIYIDVASAKAKSKREEYNRLIDDCRNKKVTIVLTKSVSRFGRDTIEALETVRLLKELKVRIIFDQEDIDTASEDSELLLTIYESLAQADNESRSQNIKLGHRYRAMDGTSKLYHRKCYGYDHDKEGLLIVNEEQAVVVRQIFAWYIEGKSIVGLIKLLEENQIPSPRGKAKWSKRALETMLSNEKYIGNVHLFKDNEYEDSYLAEDNHPAIISKYVFEKVQAEKTKRSNVVRTHDGVVRKKRRYKSKN